MIMAVGSRLLCVVRKRIYRRRVMLILEYISTHGTPEWCAARMSARASKGPLPSKHFTSGPHVATSGHKRF